MSNPWRIDGSDSEDEVKNRYDRCISLPPKPPTPTPKFLTRYNEPKTLDWDPVITEEGHKKKFRHKKTAPSFEKAPSHHKPIFSGPPSLISSRSTFFSSSYNSILEYNEHNKKSVTYSPETPPESPSVINSNFDPIKFIQEDLNKFIYTCVPKDYSSFIRCYLRRDRTGLHKGFFPTYYLHTKRPSDERKVFLLAARKTGKINGQSEYLITTNVATLNEKSGGDGFVGKLRRNNVKGTEYTLYDNGKSPNKYKYKHTHSKHGLRRELAAIIYNTNIFGFKDPRQINALIPEPEHSIQPAQEEDTIFDRWRNTRFTDVLQLRNRSPTYSEETKSNMLKFDGNSELQISIKNFQMIIETDNHEEVVVMQFGRLDDDTFICDYRYPLSAIQTFGFALSSFDSRLVR